MEEWELLTYFPYPSTQIVKLALVFEVFFFLQKEVAEKINLKSCNHEHL